MNRRRSMYVEVPLMVSPPKGAGCGFKSDESGIMVEASSVPGNACRCSCQEELDGPPEPSQGCCNPQVFTSVLLGVLACVLVTGGVFLAFHRWDSMWLIVSGVGVVLIFIGTILHCCNRPDTRRHSTGGKSCCTRPLPPEQHSQLLANNGSLTEQLLPLSNARSVSQLSLNMLPGYFPPVVSTYGIEQHSAVVQNINRLVQQQQQSPQSPGSASSAAGKSFILLSLPGDPNPTNIQNLMATVYHLDGSVVTESAPADPSSPTPTTGVVTKPTIIMPNLRNVEVQTCSTSTTTAAVNTVSVATSDSTSITTAEAASNVNRESEQVNENSAPESAATQTSDASVSTADTIDLMDCSADLNTICDSNENQCTIDIPEPSNILIDISEPIPQAPLVDAPSSDAADVTSAQVEILVDLSQEENGPTVDNLPEAQSTSEVIASTNCVPENSSTVQASVPIQNLELNQGTSSNETRIDVPPELSLSNSNLSSIDTEIEDGDFLGRSSPPPSYEDVAHESEGAVGAFGLAYGTI